MFTKFRMSNHKLEIERGRYQKIPRRERFCKLCTDNVLGDEYHFIFECKTLATVRKKLLSKYCAQHYNTYIFCRMFQSVNTDDLIQLCRFIKEAGKLLEK